MKKVLIVIMACILIVSLAACGNTGGGSSSGGGGDTTLTVWYWGEQEIPGYADYMTEIVKRYEAANDGIKVDAVLQESDTLYSAFRTAESAGAGPDLQFFWGGALALEDAWLGNLTPVDEFITAEQMKDILPSALEETHWDGKQWGIPAYQTVMSVTYNKKMMADAGLDPENPYSTWDEFMAACEALKQAGYVPWGAGLKDGWFCGWWAFLLGSQNLDSMSDLIDAVIGDANYADMKYSEWVYRYQDMLDKGYFNDDIQSLDFYQGQQLVENSMAAMSFFAHAYADTIEDAMGSDTIGFAPIPIYGNGALKDSFTAQTHVYTMPKSGGNREIAADFMLFLHEPDNMKLLYEKTFAFMPNKNFDESWAMTAIDKTVFKWKESLPEVSYQWFYPPMFEEEGIIPIIQNLTAGLETPESAAVKLNDTLEKWREQTPDQLEAFKKWTF